VGDLRTVAVCNSCRSIFVSEANVCDFFRSLDNCGRFCVGEGDLAVSFVSKEKMRKIHGQFLKNSSLTDVITFRGDADFNFAGEIITCPLYALDQSRAYGTTFPDEVKLYLIHGYLHLCGIGDGSEKEAREMRSAEKFCLDFLKNFKLEINLRP
jgi:probable rRNA maturation factor